MNETYVLALGFVTDLGKKFTIRLTDADPLVTAIDVKTAMQAVIDSEAIVHKNGSPADLSKAELIKTEVETIDVA